MCCCFGGGAFTIAVAHAYKIVKELSDRKQLPPRNKHVHHPDGGDEYMLARRAMDIMGPMIRK